MQAHMPHQHTARYTQRLKETWITSMICSVCCLLVVVPVAVTILVHVADTKEYTRSTCINARNFMIGSNGFGAYHTQAIACIYTKKHEECTNSSKMVLLRYPPVEWRFALMDEESVVEWILSLQNTKPFTCYVHDLNSTTISPAITQLYGNTGRWIAMVWLAVIVLLSCVYFSILQYYNRRALHTPPVYDINNGNVARIEQLIEIPPAYNVMVSESHITPEESAEISG
jgi:hypothetical protein